MSEPCIGGRKPCGCEYNENCPECIDPECRVPVIAAEAQDHADFVRWCAIREATISGSDAARDTRLPPIPQRFSDLISRTAWIEGYFNTLRIRLMEPKP